MYVKDLLEQISLSGHHVEGGADYVECPCCHNTKDVLGYVYYTTSVTHSKDCALFKLYEMYRYSL
jgi:hypothetical protein